MGQSLKERFFGGEAISYRCWGYELGNVIAKWVVNDYGDGFWAHRHEAEAKWHLEPMTEGRARSIFPTDARAAA